MLLLVAVTPDFGSLFQTYDKFKDVCVEAPTAVVGTEPDTAGNSRPMRG